MKYWENRDAVQHTVLSSKSDLVLNLGLVRGNLVWRSARIPGIAQISSGKEVFRIVLLHSSHGSSNTKFRDRAEF